MLQRLLRLHLTSPSDSLIVLRREQAVPVLFRKRRGIRFSFSMFWNEFSSYSLLPSRELLEYKTEASKPLQGLLCVKLRNWSTLLLANRAAAGLTKWHDEEPRRIHQVKTFLRARADRDAALRSTKTARFPLNLQVRQWGGFQFIWEISRKGNVYFES